MVCNRKFFGGSNGRLYRDNQNWDGRMKVRTFFCENASIFPVSITEKIIIESLVWIVPVISIIAICSMFFDSNFVSF